MMSNRCTHRWVSPTAPLYVFVVPCLWACASSDGGVAPPNTRVSGEVSSGAQGTTSGASGGSTGAGATTGNATSGATASVGGTSTTGVGGASGTSATTTGGSLETTGGSPTTSAGGSGVAGTDGATTTADAPTTSSSGGSGGNVSTDPEASTGCGSASPVTPCDSSGSPCSLNVDGTDRQFYVVLPDSYDANTPFPVVFQYHPLGGSAEQGMNMYRVRNNFADAIYVTPQGLSSGGNAGFPNTNGSDEAMTRAIMADIEGKYCVDRARYFATGFSYGGSMSYTAACNMSDVFRAVAGMAGAPISGARCASQAPENPVAFWGSHGEEDTALPIDMAFPIRDAFVERNGCTTETQPVEPSPCVAYQGCDAGYPVVWCQVAGQGHAIPDYSPTAIAEFFQQF